MVLKVLHSFKTVPCWVFLKRSSNVKAMQWLGFSVQYIFCISLMKAIWCVWLPFTLDKNLQVGPGTLWLSMLLTWQVHVWMYISPNFIFMCQVGQILHYLWVCMYVLHDFTVYICTCVYKTTEQIQVSFWLSLHFTRHKVSELQNNSHDPSNQLQHAAPAEDSVPPAQDEYREEKNMTEGLR